MHKRQTIFCGIAIFVGFFFIGQSPATMLVVSGLGLLGFVIGLRRLANNAGN